MDILNFNLVANKPGGELQGAGVPTEGPSAREGFAASLGALYRLELLSTPEGGHSTESTDPSSDTDQVGVGGEDFSAEASALDPSLHQGFNPLSVFAAGISPVRLRHPLAPEAPVPSTPSDRPFGIPLVGNNGLGPLGIQRTGQNPGEGITLQANGQGLGGHLLGTDQGILLQRLRNGTGLKEPSPPPPEALPITGVANGLSARSLGDTFFAPSPLRPGVPQAEGGQASEKLFAVIPTTNSTQPTLDTRGGVVPENDSLSLTLAKHTAQNSQDLEAQDDTLFEERNKPKQDSVLRLPLEETFTKVFQQGAGQAKDADGLKSPGSQDPVSQQPVPVIVQSKGSTAPPPPAQAVPVHPVSIPNSEAAGNKTIQSLHLEVHPANTGPVQLRVSLANHTVHTNVITDRAELGNYLLARQGHLEQAFQTNGLDMGQFRVLVDRQGYGQTGHEGTPHSKDDRPNKQDHDRGDPAPQDDTPGRTHTGEAERTLHLVA